MTSRTLELAKISLTLKSERLKLEVAPTVDVRFPSWWSPSRDDESIVKALISGNVWVSGGGRCRVDVDVLFNSKALDKTIKISILESLGYHLHEANLWSQLSLSSSFEILHPEKPAAPSPDITFYVNHAVHSQATQPKAWALDNTDIKAPKAVLCAELESLHLQLRFHQTQKVTRTTSKKLRSTGSPESILFSYISGLKRDARITFFENVAAVLPENVSHSISKCFDESSIHGGDYAKKILEEAPALHGKTPNQKSIATPEVINASEPTGRRLPTETVERMQAWLDAHLENRPPTNIEVTELAKQIGLEKRQVCDWFGHARRRKKPSRDAQGAPGWIDSIKTQNNVSQPSSESHYDGEDVLWSQLEDEMLFDERYDVPDENEMLFSQTTSITTPSLTSQASTLTNESTAISLKRPASDEGIDAISASIHTSLPLITAINLTTVALRTIISGPSNRKQNLQDIKLSKPLPSHSLSALVPSMFCPGFKASMAHHSRLLPTVSNAICSSWVRNVQGVVLRQKLVALSNAKVSQYQNGEGEEGSASRLSSVVLARLWRMMQRTLYDEDAGKRLWKEDKDQEAVTAAKNEEGSEDEDLLGEYRNEKSIDIKTDRLEDFMDAEEESLFEDLLEGDCQNGDIGLLDYLEEQEKIAVEKETEDMLFGGDDNGMICEGVDYEQDMLLLVDDGYVENMLV